ncbi:TPA: oligosaccharide repeat unit polymerase [Enterobacter hormaechei subsp. xiangfangensis]|nr:oligosaccharide repeat unit polymerase [Enterobacter hormaechei subsp. xiangfangensis]
MTYAYMTLLFFMLLLELRISRRKFSPTVVMISLWLIIILLCDIFSDELWELSSETLTWISLGCVAFFFGGIFGKAIAPARFVFSPVKRMPLWMVMPIYGVMIALFYLMVQSGAGEDDNWYVGIRRIINYGEPDWSFSAFGYIYYLIYPVLYLSAVRYYSSQNNKKDRNIFWFHFGMCFMYALMSTAKLKLLLVVIPVFFIRSYYRPTSTKLLVIVGALFSSALFGSLLLLNKLSGNDGITDIIVTTIGNYTFFNVFAIDKLNFMPILQGKCIGSENACSIMPFFDYGDFSTNIYTIMYSFVEYGMAAYIAFQFFIGMIHNAIDRVARTSFNVFAVVFSAVLYVPLVFQIMDNQYTASKYMLYIMTLSYMLYFIKSRNISLLKRV